MAPLLKIVPADGTLTAAEMITRLNCAGGATRSRWAPQRPAAVMMLGTRVRTRHRGSPPLRPFRFGLDRVRAAE